MLATVGDAVKFAVIIWENLGHSAHLSKKWGCIAPPGIKRCKVFHLRNAGRL
jgi:hypothetical protein